MNIPSLTIAAVLAVGIIVLPGQTVATNGTQHLTYAAKVVDGGDHTCPPGVVRDNSKNEIREDILTLLQELTAPEDSEVVRHCGTGLWTRVAYLNMTNPSEQCPSSWREINTPKRVCGKRSGVTSCDSVMYATSGQYDRVCGRIKGYMYNGPDAFYQYSNDASITIDSYYVDGVSVTHGQPRQHIWTFAAGAGEENDAQWICPCANPTKSAVITVPPFVGNNYFCEAGLTQYAGSFDGFYPDDPLWDGDGCGPSSSCCSLNSPPWFSVQLAAPTTDDIEVRLCDNNLGGFDDVPVEEIEIYVR